MPPAGVGSLDGRLRLRPLDDAAVPAAHDMSNDALRDAGPAYGWELPAVDEAARARGLRRIRHVLQHDPGGAWVAELDGEVVGVALATRRGPLWFLSTLAVSTAVQSRGVGRRLLEAAMGTFAGTGAICSSSDPKALRRYRRAGFDLLPCLEAHGPIDRSLLPAVPDVRPGSFDDDRGLVEQVALRQRGAAYGPDLDVEAASSRGLLVTDTAAGRGYVVVGERGPRMLAATTRQAAASLLWTALAEAPAHPLELMWLTHDQAWAVDVALDARLSLKPAGAVCVAGPVGPMSPYLPSGSWG